LENTSSAFTHSNQLGIDILEMDLRITRDQKMVIFHDRSLSATTNCEGRISDHSLAELKNCRLKRRDGNKISEVNDSPSPGKYKESAIPTLEQIFQQFPHKRMIIELKDGDPILVKNFCRLITHYGKQSEILVGSFRQKAMDQFRSNCPLVATSATPREAFLFYFLAKLRLAKLTSSVATTLHMPWRFGFKEKNRFFFWDIITPSFVEQAHAKNLFIQVWTVNEPEDMETLINLGVDGIMTDRPELLISIAKKMGIK
jgi:glycerophosphoryl diester phosphodiesterase